jgi:class 3 adenylate cyclase/tetratricopeptide (TPR) repeat protein
MTATMSTAQEERRLLTILFADLSGFTGLSSKLDPEEVREVANLCFEHLNKAITGQGGTIHKYEGDLVMALFGHPVAHEDDPERAIKASFAMFELLPEVNRALAAHLLKPTDIGLHVGINSGTVVVGEVGSLEKREYTVMGDAVNIASRMKDLAKRGEIVVSEPVFRASRYLFEYEAREPVAVKGIEEPVRVFRPLKLKAKPEPKRGIQGLYSPLVGREKELDTLRQAVRQLSQGQGGAAFVLGDAGLGKSRLLEELKKGLHELPAPVALLEGKCLLYGESVPYWPLLQVLEGVFGVSDQDPKGSLGSKILERVRELCPADWESVVPYLGHLFSIRYVGGLEERVRHLDAKALRIQIFISLRKLLGALARVKPLLLVIEDYHWIDPESLAFLEFLFDAPDPEPIRVLALSRIEKDKEGHRVRERLRAKLGSAYCETVLRPLDPQSSSQLAYNLLAIPGLTEGFKEKLLAKAEGNPFYLEEIIRSLIDRGALVYSDGVWHLAVDISTLVIPDTVQAVIAARLDRLEREVREILQMAAVLGRNFHPRLLEVLSGLDRLMLSLYLATLEEFGFISEARMDPEPEYAFHHPLSQEVAYGGLLKMRRRELHRKAGEAIEQLYPDRLEEFTELLAHQYANSDDTDKALLWLKKAGGKAKAAFANQEAIACYEQILALVGEDEARRAELFQAFQALGELYDLKGDVPKAIGYYESMVRQAGPDPVDRARALRMVASEKQTHGKIQEGQKDLEEAERLLSGKSDAELFESAEIHINRCWSNKVMGDPERAIREGETALRILEADLGGSRSRLDPARITRAKVRVFNTLGAIYDSLGDFDRAHRLFRTCLEIGTETGDQKVLAAANANLGVVYHRRGEVERALNYYRTSLEICEKIGDVQSCGAMLMNLANLYVETGDYDRGIELYGKAMGSAKETGDRFVYALLTGNVGGLYIKRGDCTRGMELSRMAYEVSREMGDKEGMGNALINFAEAHTLLREWEQAEKCLREAEGYVKDLGEKPNLALVYSKWSEMKSSGGGTPEEALGYAEKAYQLAEELSSKVRLAACHWVYGKAYASAGDYDKAGEHFQKAFLGYEENKDKRGLADAYLDYAQMLKAAAEKGLRPPALAETYFAKARGIYQEMKLLHMVQRCLEAQGFKERPGRPPGQG